MRSYGVPMVLALCIAVVVFVFAQNGGDEKERLFATPSFSIRGSIDQDLADRTVVDFGQNADGTVSYSYLASAVPTQVSDWEIPELRNETSYTTFDKVIEEGPDPIVQLTTVIYSQPAFAQDVDGTWKYLEYATTTRQSWNSRTQTLSQRIAEIFIRTAYADTLSPFSGAGDGQIFNSSPVSWSTARNAASGAGVTSGSVTAQALALYISALSSNSIYRIYLPFDTSSVSSSASITGASLSVYVTAKGNTANDGIDYITVTHSSQADSSTLAVADYNDIGDTEGIDAGQRKDVTSISTGAYITFTLNSTGVLWVKKNGESPNCGMVNGVTCLGLREGHDIVNSAPSDGTTNHITISTSEETGTAQDPYLSITYSIPASVGVSGLRISGPGGAIKITGGGLKIL